MPDLQDFIDFIYLEMPQRSVTIRGDQAIGDPNKSELAKVNNAPVGTWYLQNDADNIIWYRMSSDPINGWQKVSITEAKIVVGYYDMSSYILGRPIPNKKFFSMLAVRQFWFPINFERSLFTAEISPENTYKVKVFKNDEHIGNFIIDGYNNNGYGELMSPVLIDIGDRVSLYTDEVEDPTISGLDVTLVGLLTSGGVKLEEILGNEDV